MSNRPAPQSRRRCSPTAREFFQPAMLKQGNGMTVRHEYFDSDAFARAIFLDEILSAEFARIGRIRLS